jgi:hypothetical protein
MKLFARSKYCLLTLFLAFFLHSLEQCAYVDGVKFTKPEVNCYKLCIARYFPFHITQHRGSLSRHHNATTRHFDPPPGTLTPAIISWRALLRCDTYVFFTSCVRHICAFFLLPRIRARLYKYALVYTSCQLLSLPFHAESAKSK